MDSLGVVGYRNKATSRTRSRSPDLTRITVDQFRRLHRYLAMSTIWVVDVEFASLKAVNVVPFAISVRDARTAELVLSTPIDYDDIDLGDLEDLLAAHQGDRGTSTFMRKRYFQKFYNSTTTNGMSLSAGGRHLKTAEFTPETHKVISWYTSVDEHVFCRAILGHDQVLDPTPGVQLMYLVAGSNACLQPFDLARMLRASTNLSNIRLGYVFRSLFPTQRQLKMHDPNNDTLAAVKVLRLIEGVSQQWV